MKFYILFLIPFLCLSSCENQDQESLKKYLNYLGYPDVNKDWKAIIIIPVYDGCSACVEKTTQYIINFLDHKELMIVYSIREKDKNDFLESFWPSVSEANIETIDNLKLDLDDQAFKHNLMFTSPVLYYLEPGGKVSHRVELFLPILDKELDQLSSVLNEIIPASINNESGQLLSFDNSQFVAGFSDFDNVWDSLIRSSLGKVIYVDIWATWCKPCIYQFNHGKDFYEEINRKGVVSIFICAKSDEDSWKNVIAKYDLRGIHLFLDESQSSRLKSRFDLIGFPTYMMIDKNGELNQIGIEWRPTNPATLQQLEWLL